MAKPKIILKEYIKEKKRIVMDVMQQGKAQEGLVRDGMTVDEFKKLVREKYGNDVEIINLISRCKIFVFGIDKVIHYSV